MRNTEIQDIKRSRVRLGFDRLAPIYDLLLTLFSGNLIPRIRRSLLKIVPPREHALVLGDGTGRFLCELMATDRIGRATCFDISDAMIHRASRRWAARGRNTDQVSFHAAGLPIPEGLPDRYDLVCTNFFLDVFTDEELDPVFRQIDAALVPDGLWYYSDFCYPDAAIHPFENAGARFIVRMLYVFFEWICGLRARALPDVKKCFVNHGYQLIFEEYSAAGMLVCQIFQKTQRTF